ncbi:hypothetical protein ES288_D12G134200v1 [Gossypium darwinii]|uniref:Uncharacterized protein n=1 Tax=Gossypium darwinii TaxID=34276 RepID=A0A5D2ABK4_GOSDA|nr:hypothetical protein ES288_D12G134200v1 [Gossypium darwinii]
MKGFPKVMKGFFRNRWKPFTNRCMNFKKLFESLFFKLKEFGQNKNKNDPILGVQHVATCEWLTLPCQQNLNVIRLKYQINGRKKSSDTNLRQKKIINTNLGGVNKFEY